MQTDHKTVFSSTDNEEITITLPATALEPLTMSLGNQLNSQHSAFENGNSLHAAALGRDEPLHCFKKTAGNLAIVRISLQPTKL